MRVNNRVNTLLCPHFYADLRYQPSSKTHQTMNLYNMNASAIPL